MITFVQSVFITSLLGHIACMQSIDEAHSYMLHQHGLCVLSVEVSCAKTSEWIKIPFKRQTHVSQKNFILDEGPDTTMVKGTFDNGDLDMCLPTVKYRDCAKVSVWHNAAICQITLDTCYYSYCSLWLVKIQTLPTVTYTIITAVSFIFHCSSALGQKYFLVYCQVSKISGIMM